LTEKEGGGERERERESVSDSSENVATHAAKSQWDSAGKAPAECNVDGWAAARSEGENEVILGVASRNESEKEKG